MLAGKAEQHCNKHSSVSALILILAECGNLLTLNLLKVSSQQTTAYWLVYLSWHGLNNLLRDKVREFF